MAADISTAASSSRSGGGAASADSYIGSLISLTSKSEIRYEGILYNINTDESSIGLRSVRSFGTEGRKMDGQQVLPSDKVYDYILFRGSDIKDLQVKSSPPPPVQAQPSINNDPAIIQSHYPRPTPQPPLPPPSLPTAPSGSSTDTASHSAQMGLPGSSFQGGLPLYQPGGNMNSWGHSAPNGNGSGLALPTMYWQGFYGAPNGIPQLPQQSLLRPPPGLSIPPPMQPMQYPGFNSSLPMGTSNLPTSSFPEYHSSLVPSSTSSSSLSSTSLPASNLPVNLPSLQPMPLQLQTQTMINPFLNKAPVSAIPAPASSSSFTSFTQNSIAVPDNVRPPSVANKPSVAALPPQIISQTVSTLTGTSGSLSAEMPTPSLITPGQLLQSGQATASLNQPLQTTHKDVEVVQVSPKPSPESSSPVVSEAQPPLLPLPQNTRVYKSNGGSYHMRNNYRGRGGRGFGMSRPVTKFTEDFDFTAMNEKFNKDEVWGHLGKSSKEGNGSDNDEEYLQDEDDAEIPKVEIKTVYKKDDFFDSLSCNSMDNDPNHGRPRYSEQMKLDTETFGDFSRYRGGRGGRGPNRGGGGRFRGSYYGRGYGGGYNNNYGGRGRGRATQNHST